MKTIDDSLFDEILAPDRDPHVPVDLLPRILAIPSRSRAGLSVPAAAGLAAIAAAVLLLAWFSARPTGTTGSRTVRVDPPTLGERILAAVAEPGGVTDALFSEGGEAALVPLHRLALAEDATTARRALEWIGRIASPRSLPVLAAAVGRADRRHEAATALAELGPRALPVLTPLLESEEVFEIALAGVAAAGGPRAADALARAATSCDDAPRRRKLLAALSTVDGLAGARRLVDLLDDEDLGAEVLEVLDGDRDGLVPHLLTLAEEDDAALRALALLAPPMAVPTLARLLDDRERRALAARALARIDTPEAARELITRAGDEAVLAAAAFAGPRLEAHLLQRLPDASPRDLPELVALLGEAGGDGSVPDLLRLSSRSDIGPAAVAALSRIGTPTAIRALTGLGDDGRLRRGVVAALGATGNADAITDLVRIGREHRGVRRDACRALALIPAAAAVEGILLLEREGGTGREARRVLARMNDELVRKTLSRLVEGDLKPQAKRALSDLGVPAGPPRAASLL